MRHELGPLTAFPEGRCTILDVGNRSIGVYHVDGRFFAVRNRCPHHGAPICLGQLGGTMLPAGPGAFEYGLENRVLRCPWHGWEFDIGTGEALFGIDKSRLVTYPVEVEGGRLFIEAKGIAPGSTEEPSQQPVTTTGGEG